MYTCITTSLTCHSFFFTHTATTEIYTLSLHDALPILAVRPARCLPKRPGAPLARAEGRAADRAWLARARPTGRGVVLRRPDRRRAVGPRHHAERSAGGGTGRELSRGVECAHAGRAGAGGVGECE